MPLSSTANYSCDVVKEGGNDASFAGPFKTIQRAIQYLQAEFPGLDAAHKGVINLAPGIYNEAGDVIIVNNGTDQYLDFTGAGKGTTILCSPTGTPVSIGAAAGDARNHFSNLTIEYTGETDEFALRISAGVDVRVVNCRIRSTQRCISNLPVGCEIFGCEVTSTTTAAISLCGNIAGTVWNTTFQANQMGTYSSIIEAVSGEMLNCRLNALSATDTRAINVVQSGARLNGCIIETQGYTIITMQGKLENSILSTEGTGGARVFDTFEGCLVTGCFCLQKANGRVVARGSVDAPPQVFHTVFYAPNSNNDVVGNIEVDGSLWVKCSFINNGQGGFALSGNASGRAITVGTITHNRVLDPNLAVTAMLTT